MYLIIFIFLFLVFFLFKNKINNKINNINKINNNNTYKNLVDMFNRATYVFDNENLDYSLAYGTALGCHRLGTHIPYDDDIDFCILISDHDYNMMNNINNKMMEFGFRPKNEYSTPYSYYCKNKKIPILYQWEDIRAGLNCDVYILHHMNDKYYECSNGGEKTGKCVSFEIKPFVKQKFNGRVHNVWSKEWLINIYGKDYMTPKRNYKGIKPTHVYNKTDCILPFSLQENNIYDETFDDINNNQEYYNKDEYIIENEQDININTNNTCNTKNNNNNDLIKMINGIYNEMNSLYS